MIEREDRPLRAFAEVQLGRQRSPEHAEGPFMMPYLRAANVKDGYLDLSDVKEMNFTPAEQQVFCLRTGDVLVSEGAGSLAAVGASAVWDGSIEGVVCFQNTLLRLRPRVSMASPRFLAWWARHAYASRLFASAAMGVNIYHLSADRVRSLPVRFPTIPIQERIADFLDQETARIDTAITAKHRLVELIRERWTASVSRSTENPSWPQVRLKRVLARPLEYGIGEAAEYDEVSWPRYIRTTDIASDGGLREQTFKSLPPEVAAPYLLAEGDLLFTRSGATVGKNFLYRKEWGVACFAGYLIRARPDRSKAIPQFLNYFAQSDAYWSQVRVLTLQATIQNVSAERYGDLVVRVPTLPEQDQVAAKLREVEMRLSNLRRRLTDQITLLRERHQALITAAVTGGVPGLAR